MKIISVVGARPNFMKIAPFIREIEKYNSNSDKNIDHILLHTGQHYDDRMSETFFRELGIPEADIDLDVGSGTHAEQVGQTMIAFEKVIKEEKPDWVVVVGDVNATLACSVTAKKEGAKVCHIEAGLRSGDLTMPEEINRMVTDRLADLLLTPDKLSNENLAKEGVPADKIVFTGNIMIDTLEANKGKAEKLQITQVIRNNLMKNYILRNYVPADENFSLMTLHRPSNVDEKDVLEPIIRFITDEAAKELTLIWPVHPRTKKQLKQFNLFNELIAQENVILLKPLSYLDMLRLNMGTRVMLTDSGGLQEECTVLGTPCLTLRRNTERPLTLRQNGGTCVLTGNSIENIKKEYYRALKRKRYPQRPELWDGNTAERCLRAILNYKQ
jgi:UDP-N-acetylglucosamine 2-epimerase (non-hydrolysing)